MANVIAVHSVAQPELRVIGVADDGRTALRDYTTSSRAAGSESPKTSETSATIVKESLAELDVNRFGPRDQEGTAC